MLQVNAADKRDNDHSPQGDPGRPRVRHGEPRSAAHRLRGRPDELRVHQWRLPGHRLGPRSRQRPPRPRPDRRRPAGRRASRGVDYAEYGLPSPDVAAVYPNYPQRDFARWRFYLDTTKLSNSEHDLLVEVIDGRDNVRSAGTRRFLVDNNTLVR